MPGGKVWLESPQLEAVVLSMRIAGDELRKRLYKNTRDVISPEWRRDVTQSADTRLGVRVLGDTARVNVSYFGITLISARSRKALKPGGLIPSRYFGAVEFGVNRNKVIKVNGRRGNTRYEYKRRMGMAFPAYNADGHVVLPTAKRYIKRYAAMWIQTAAKTLHDAAEGKL